MAFLDADRTVPTLLETAESSTTAVKISMPVAAAENIFKGALCKVNKAGYLVKCDATHGEFCCGIANTSALNQRGADGDLSADVLMQGFFTHDVTDASIDDTGKAVHCTDDQTLQVYTAKSGEFFGNIVKWISGTSCIVYHSWPDTTIADAGIS